MKANFRSAAIINRAKVFDFPFRFALGKLHLIELLILGDFDF